ncbi:MAG: hypothetical protein HYZ16_11455 [Bacteroidetes bacterium]|nr:hypothetical protein [Bacteroidota bacterium]
MTDTGANWVLEVKALDADTQKIQITDEGHYLGFDEVLGLLALSGLFRGFFTSALRNLPFAAFQMEWPPIDVETIGLPFEMVVYQWAMPLGTVANPKAFDEHFEENEPTAIFINLSGDAILLSPNPMGQGKEYAHLASFLAHAPATAIDDLFMALGELAASNVHEKPLWISTAAAGIPWLHIRLDDKPKYYQWAAYKRGN